jgi:hypothetical protein
LAYAGPIELVLNPSPQEFGNTCQSYSMALAVSLNPSSPIKAIKANKATELRELERRIRQELVASAQRAGRTEAIRDDWKSAVEKVTNHVLSVDWKDFDHLDPALRFAATLTGVSDPQGLGTIRGACENSRSYVFHKSGIIELHNVSYRLGVWSAVAERIDGR